MNENKKPKYPFGKEPFKQFHEDDEIYNRKEK